MLKESATFGKSLLPIHLKQFIHQSVTANLHLSIAFHWLKFYSSNARQL